MNARKFQGKGTRKEVRKDWRSHAWSFSSFRRVEKKETRSGTSQSEKSGTAEGKENRDVVQGKKVRTKFLGWGPWGTRLEPANRWTGASGEV